MKSFIKTKDFSVSGEEFKLFHNEKLDMLETRPRPKNLEGYYKSENYISHTDANINLTDKIYQIVKRYSITKKLNLIEKWAHKNKTLLDIGAGTGDFLLAAQKKNWKANGVEPNYDARMRATEKKVTVFPSLDVLPNEKYAIITLWHVLEHLPDLNKQIREIGNYLNQDGSLLIAVPNFKSKDAIYYKEFWAAYDVPRHLWHFSKDAIEKIFAKHGFKVVSTKPMIFDAFYVALLSEKYKSGKSGFLVFCKAFFIGLWSNCSAWKTKEYSSLIYILKRD